MKIPTKPAWRIVDIPAWIEAIAPRVIIDGNTMRFGCRRGQGLLCWLGRRFHCQDRWFGCRFWGWCHRWARCRRSGWHRGVGWSCCCGCNGCGRGWCWLRCLLSWCIRSRNTHDDTKNHNTKKNADDPGPATATFLSWLWRWSRWLPSR
jgi:hypothetical protein